MQKSGKFQGDHDKTDWKSRGGGQLQKYWYPQQGGGKAQFFSGKAHSHPLLYFLFQFIVFMICIILLPFPYNQLPSNRASQYDSMFPIIFNIWFWLLVVIFLATYAISVAMWNMDPGRDSIIYRLTEQKIKNDWIMEEWIELWKYNTF